QTWRHLTIVASPDRGYPAFKERATATAGGMEPLIALTIERWFEPKQIATAHPAVAYASERLRRMSARSWDALWLDFAEFPGHRRQLEGLGLPGLCIAGAQDQSTPPAVVERVAGALGYELEMIEGAPHQLLQTHAETLFALWTQSFDVSSPGVRQDL
ncbi:MAG TPA: hypothetical protein H9830_03645, partial [Candidatus Agrococcus pullicola]|nr:hypothetical protein [Candidatus Agrococcus pullicola]